MVKLKQAVIVEGKYDKIKLSSIIDSLIITTDGFGVFKNSEKSALIKELAEKQGVIILTDSDSAGFKIRNYIKNITGKGKIINVYIPDIFGKEKRKTAPSKEGKLGVEGVPNDIIIAALEKAGVTAANNEDNNKDTNKNAITRIMLYEDGFMGKDGSSERRKKLLKALSLPEMLSTNGLLEVLNTMFSLEEYESAANKINTEKNQE